MSLRDSAEALRLKLDSILKESTNYDIRGTSRASEPPRTPRVRRFTKHAQTEAFPDIDVIVKRALSAQEAEFTHSLIQWESAKYREMHEELEAALECERTRIRTEHEIMHAQTIQNMECAHREEMSTAIKQLEAQFNADIAQCVLSERESFQRAQQLDHSKHLEELNTLRGASESLTESRVKQAVTEADERNARSLQELMEKHAQEMNTFRDVISIKLRQESEERYEDFRIKCEEQNKEYIGATVDQLAQENQKIIEERQHNLSTRYAIHEEQVKELTRELKDKESALKKFEVDLREARRELSISNGQSKQYQHEVESLKQNLEVARATFEAFGLEVENKVKATVMDKNKEINRLNDYIRELEEPQSPQSCIIRKRNGF